jgi:hypothetical protein
VGGKLSHLARLRSNGKSGHAWSKARPVTRDKQQMWARARHLRNVGEVVLEASVA